MTHFGMFTKPGRRGVHTGWGTYSYLPFNCRIGRIRFNLAYAAGASVSLEQNGSVIGAPMSLSPGRSPIFRPDPDTVFPAVTVSNLDTLGRLSLNATIFGYSGATRLRYAIELVPEDLALAAAEIWQVYNTGEDGPFGSLIYLHSDFDASFPPLDSGVEQYANGYVQSAAFDPIFTNKGSGSEDSIVGDMNAGGFKVGVGTPLARGGVLSHLIIVSADLAGFDGDYTFAARRNGSSVLEVSPMSGGTRIYSNAGTAAYQGGEFWNWMAVGTPGGTKVIGHLLCAYRPSVTGTPVGFSAFGSGATGY